LKCPVIVQHFREFVSALEGKEVNITDTNFTWLERLCDEFGFSKFAARLSEFWSSMGFQEAADADARGRIAALEEKAEQRDCDIAVLQDKFKQLSTAVGRLSEEASALRSAAAPPVATPSGQPIPPAPQPTPPSRPLRCSVRGSFRTFRRSSQSSGGSVFRFCGGAAAMVSKDENLTADATTAQTL
jgi:hypothetical protein